MGLEFVTEGGRRTPRETWPPLSKNADDPEPEVSGASARWSGKKPDFWFTRHGCLMDVTPLLLCSRFSLLLLTYWLRSLESPKPNEAHPFSPIHFFVENLAKKNRPVLESRRCGCEDGQGNVMLRDTQN